jgi:S1-C subfamily serine protease
MKINKYKIFLLVALVVAIGIASGLIGTLVARSYLLRSTFNLPMFNSVNLTENKAGSPNLVISEPKSVNVEQNVKIQEVATRVQANLAGIYKKNPSTPPNSSFNLSSYYLTSNELGAVFILTSDGWLLTNFTPAEISSLPVKANGNTIKQKTAAINSYVIITNDQKVYPVDNIIYDKQSNLSFWHIKASGLPVRQFVDDGSNGQAVIAVNNQGWVEPVTIIGHDGNDLVINSDMYIDKLVLDQSLNNKFGNSFLVNFNGDLVATVDNAGRATAVRSLSGLFASLLKNQKIVRPSLGINYVLLSVAANYEGGKGAIIYPDASGLAIIKGSVAEKGGLRAGDIILTINNIEVNYANSINKIISSYQAGDEIDISYLRGQENKTIKLLLGTSVQ